MADGVEKAGDEVQEEVEWNTLQALFLEMWEEQAQAQDRQTAQAAKAEKESQDKIVHLTVALAKAEGKFDKLKSLYLDRLKEGKEQEVKIKALEGRIVTLEEEKGQNFWDQDKRKQILEDVNQLKRDKDALEIQILTQEEKKTDTKLEDLQDLQERILFKEQKILKVEKSLEEVMQSMEKLKKEITKLKGQVAKAEGARKEAEEKLKNMAQDAKKTEKIVGEQKARISALETEVRTKEEERKQLDVLLQKEKETTDQIASIVGNYLGKRP